MDTDQAKAIAKQHGPTAAIAAVAIVAIKLTTGAPTQPPQPPSATDLAARRTLAGDPALPSQPGPAHARRGDGIETRLVSCGGLGAWIDGDGQHATDDIGTVTLGMEPRGTCTVIFENASSSPRHCAINGGRLAKSLATEIVVDQIDGTTFAYRCEP